MSYNNRGGLGVDYYRKKFENFCETFSPSDYGYSEKEYEEGMIDLKEIFISGNYGNSDTAKYLRGVL